MLCTRQSPLMEPSFFDDLDVYEAFLLGRKSQQAVEVGGLWFTIHLRWVLQLKERFYLGPRGHVEREGWRLLFFPRSLAPGQPLPSSWREGPASRP